MQLFIVSYYSNFSHISDPENHDVGNLNTVGLYTFLKLLFHKTGR
jgi:hypothetical protein